MTIRAHWFVISSVPLGDIELVAESGDLKRISQCINDAIENGASNEIEFEIDGVNRIQYLKLKVVENYSNYSNEQEISVKKPNRGVFFVFI